MNALWLTRMCAYKHTPEALESAKCLIAMKIERESALLIHYKKSPFIADFSKVKTTGDILLIEARAARHFWKAFRDLLPPDTSFKTRTPGAHDTVNRLLDIGYHHITGIVHTYLTTREVPVALGLLHIARTSDSAPLAYDLVELFRADTVDAELLRYIHLKKRTLHGADHDVSHFLHELNERLSRLHYIKNFKQCHAYRYYMDLQMLAFIHAVDHGKPFTPISLPDRHDTRCKRSSLTPNSNVLQ